MSEANKLDPKFAEFMNLQQGETPPNNTANNDSQNNSQNSQIKLDNNVNNSYISDDGSATDSDNNAVDPEIEKYQRVLTQTFGGDVNKALKSYLEAQAALTDKSREVKKYKEPYERLNSVLQENPQLFDILQRASQGENVENLLRPKEPTGQPFVPNNASQLDNSIDEKALIQAGLLDTSNKASLSDYEWQMKVLNATQRYMTSEYPKIIARQTQEEIRKVQQAESETQRKQQEDSENHRRWTEGIKDAAISGWDFNKDHSAFLDELEDEITGLRDSKNLNLIRQDAVEIALEKIARKHGIQLPQKQAPSNIPMNLNRNQQNLNSRANKQLDENKPKDFLDALIQRGVQDNRNRNGDYLQRYKQQK